jgi:putative endonuclease
MTSREIGDIGENAVAAFLEKNGYEIMARNFTVRGGEIDIIARKNGRLAFVEVKSRDEHAVVSAEKAVTPAKRRFLIKTAEIYYRGYKQKYGEAICRFDVAAVVMENKKVKHVRYYVAAFDVSGA